MTDDFRIHFDHDVKNEWNVTEKPTKVLIIDGNSLRPSDLVKCEKGECILQVRWKKRSFNLHTSLNLCRRVSVLHYQVSLSAIDGFGGKSEQRESTPREDCG